MSCFSVDEIDLTNYLSRPDNYNIHSHQSESVLIFFLSYLTEPLQTTDVEIEASNIRIGTAGYLNNVFIGNTFSNVRIESMDNVAIGVPNYLNQFV